MLMAEYKNKESSNLTIVILTKNEEKHIVDVVKNSLQVTDKVLIVDSGSTDKTVQLAEACGAKVVYRAWDNDFSAQRNFALEHVDTDWVLYLDADERLDKELLADIKKAVKGELNKQYSFFREVNAFGFTYKYGIFKPDNVMRMFPKDKVVWKNKVHEHPECELKKQVLKGKVIHYTYNNWQHWLDKAGHYTTIWAEDNFANGKRTSASGAFVHAFVGFIRVYFFKLGFLDGWAGMYSSIQHFIYTMLKYVKLYELQNGSDNCK